MNNEFSNKFAQIQRDCVYSAFKYVEGRAQKVYVSLWCSPDYNNLDFFYKINDTIVQRHRLNSVLKDGDELYNSTDQDQINTLDEISDKTEELIELLKAYAPNMLPVIVRLTYDVDKDELDVDFDYDTLKDLYIKHGVTKDFHLKNTGKIRENLWKAQFDICRKVHEDWLNEIRKIEMGEFDKVCVYNLKANDLGIDKKSKDSNKFVPLRCITTKPSSEQFEYISMIPTTTTSLEDKLKNITVRSQKSYVEQNNNIESVIEDFEMFFNESFDAKDFDIEDYKLPDITLLSFLDTPLEELPSFCRNDVDTSILIMSQKALDVFMPYIKDNVEIIELESDASLDKKYYIVNILKVIDMNNYGDKYITARRFKQNMIFKMIRKINAIEPEINKNITAEIYFNDDFVKIAKENDLVGYEDIYFRKLWDSKKLENKDIDERDWYDDFKY